jgi:dephospho-CoA kinase
MKLAFVGHAAVGKDTLADYVSAKLSLTNVSSGNLIRNYVLENKLGNLDRENLQKVGNELRTQHGGDYLVRLAFEKNHENIIMSGLRTLDEVETFKSLGGKVIAVIATPERRYELVQIRKRVGDDVTFAEWHAKEMSEYSNNDHAKQNIEGVIALADYIIENTGTLGELFQDCDVVLAQIQEK